MKRFVVAAFASCLFMAGNASAQTVEFGLKAGPGGVSEIGFVYSEYYRVQPSMVVDLERRRLSEDDISVLLFLSQRTGTAPGVILRWRLAGDSWWAITHRLRLDPIAVYYVPIPDHVRPGPPYGRAYGHYRKHPQGQRKSSIREALGRKQEFSFDDEDIRNLVQLRFVSSYYGHRPEDIMQRRQRGEHFGRMIRSEHQKKQKKSGIRGAIKEQQREERRSRDVERYEREKRGRKEQGRYEIDNGRRGSLREAVREQDREEERYEKQKKEKKDKKRQGRYDDDDDDHPGKGKKKFKYD